MTAGASAHVEDLILAELDDALSAAEHQTLNAHAAHCARCSAFRLEQRTLHRAAAGRPFSSMDLSLGRDLVWRRLAEPRVVRATASWQTAWGVVAIAAMLALIAAATLTFGLRQGVARPDSSTVVIAQVETDMPIAAGTLVVTERLGADRARQVVVLADLRLLSTSTTGLLEIRAQQPGESYGVLAVLPALAGVTRAHVEGAFPPLPVNSSAHYDVWIHIEADGRVYESAPILLRITSDRTGTHARRD